jgi:tetratricopeptide (TPR) repeat protein
MCYVDADRLDDLKDAAERLEKLNPDLINGWIFLGHHAYLSSNYQAAHEYFDRAIQIGQYFLRSPISIFLAQTYYRLGDEEDTARALATTRQLVEARLAAGDEGWEPWLDMASVNAMEGDKEEALSCLRKAIDAGFFTPNLIYRDTLAEVLSDTPEFQQIMKDLESERDDMRRKVEEMEKEWEQK